MKERSLSTSQIAGGALVMGLAFAVAQQFGGEPAPPPEELTPDQVVDLMAGPSDGDALDGDIVFQIDPATERRRGVRLWIADLALCGTGRLNGAIVSANDLGDPDLVRVTSIRACPSERTEKPFENANLNGVPQSEYTAADQPDAYGAIDGAWAEFNARNGGDM